MNTIVMAGALRGKGIDNINGGSTGVTMLIQVWIGVLLMPLVLLGLSPGLNSQATPSVLNLQVIPNLCPSVWHMNFLPVSYSSERPTPQPAFDSLSSLHSNSALTSSDIMVQPRQQMLSHRGSTRGGSSRPSVDAETFPHCHCHCHCPHAEGARFLRQSQLLEASSPGSSSSPFFGSAVFTFNSPLNRPRINAHVSVLFIEEAQDEGEPSAQREMPSPVDTTKARETPSADPGKETERPTSQKEDVRMEPVTTAAEEVQAQDTKEYGWCRILEEVPED